MTLVRGALVLMALALSACGSGPTPPSPSTPTPSPPHASPASSTAAPTGALASPAPTLASRSSEPPSASVAPLGSVQIPFANRVMQVTIVGVPGIVTAWRAATDRDLKAVPWDGDADIALGRLSDRELVLGWIGTVCDLKATLTIIPGRLVVTPAPRQGCDAMALGRGVVLTYAGPPDLNAITVELGDRVLLPESS
jgi:hypothetical protein